MPPAGSVEREDLPDSFWDVAICYPVEDPDADPASLKKKITEDQRVAMITRNKQRLGLCNRIFNANLIFKKVLSYDKDEVFILLAATEDRLDDCAEDTGMEMKLKDEFRDPTTGISGYQEFTKKKFQEGFFRGSGYYEDGEFKPDGNLFSSLERSRLIYEILEESPGKGGCNLDLDKMLRDEIISNIFPLHDKKSSDHLKATWVRLGKEQPLDDIRDYFGEKYALYFAWLGFYTSMLKWPAMVGLIVFAYGFLATTKNFETKHMQPVGPDNELVPLYCFFLMIWSTIFLELWKRRNAELAYKWDVMDFEEEEKPRDEFLVSLKPKDTPGFYADGCFIEVTEEDPLSVRCNKNNTPIPQEKNLPSSDANKLFAFSVCLVSPVIAFVIAGTLGILFMKGVLQYNWSPQGGAMVAGVANAVFIGMGNAFYKKLAVFLNDNETHRTDTAYEDALIMKCFTFQFVNSYISLFYIAFPKAQEVVLFGKEDWCHDMRKPNCAALIEAKNITECDKLYNYRKTPDVIRAENGGYNPNCMQELFTQLISLVVIKQVVGQVKEVLIPAIKLNRSLAKEEAELKKQKEEGEGDAPILAVWEKEAKMDDPEGTFDEYNEMIIQYGYVVLFAAAFPVASLASWINNIVEVPGDAATLLYVSKRPKYQGAEDIGSWQKILEIQSTFAVLTNVMILGFTSATLKIDYFDGHTDGPNDEGIDWQMNLYVIWTVVIMEHVVLASKWLLAEIIDDVPVAIQKAIARQQFEKEMLVEKLQEEEMASDTAGKSTVGTILQDDIQIDFERKN